MAQSDVPVILPSEVVVCFRKVVAGVLTGDRYPVTVNLSTLSSAQGNGFTKTFHDSSLALFDTSAQVAPTNLATLTVLSQRIAKDYWNFASSANQDQVYAGVIPVTPEGLHDLEFIYRLDRIGLEGDQGMVSTRVMRPAWNYEPDTLLHSGPAGSSSSAGAPATSDCPPGYVQQTVVTNVWFDAVNCILHTSFTTICVASTTGG